MPRRNPQFSAKRYRIIDICSVPIGAEAESRLERLGHVYHRRAVSNLCGVLHVIHTLVDVIIVFLKNVANKLIYYLTV